ncbi:hypothetical protein FRAAL1723 [Frankia alni ACN14a]|uniref:Uncharacterized protein n=1 Tax=Frankia alni (strain DSM 45986 / CECT 9034 / ACN14a) TaxID=326424 RepID=Q0RQ03_FRAAA|nr:hypothetical protein FRAAL1723 [Frankia alni ACN14a]
MILSISLITNRELDYWTPMAASAQVRRPAEF